MSLPKDFCIYQVFPIPQKELWNSVSQLLDRLEGKVWIIKITRCLLSPDDVNLLTLWPPSGYEGREIIKTYCQERADRPAFFVGFELMVKVELGLYVDLKSLNPDKYMSLIRLIQEFEQQEVLRLETESN